MAGRKPDYEIFISQENEGKKQYVKVGAAWKVAKDGISLRFDDERQYVAFPLKAKPKT